MKTIRTQLNAAFFLGKLVGEQSNVVNMMGCARDLERLLRGNDVPDVQPTRLSGYLTGYVGEQISEILQAIDAGDNLTARQHLRSLVAGFKGDWRELNK